jgi:hypothetical protein
LAIATKTSKHAESREDEILASSVTFVSEDELDSAFKEELRCPLLELSTEPLALSLSLEYVSKPAVVAFFAAVSFKHIDTTFSKYKGRTAISFHFEKTYPSNLVVSLSRRRELPSVFESARRMRSRTKKLAMLPTYK